MTSGHAQSAVGEREPLPVAVWLLLATSFLTSFATVGQITILGKQVFDMTGRELDLGLLGLAEFVPLALAAPFTGALADRFDRRRIFVLGVAGEVATSVGLFAYVSTNPSRVTPIFGLVVVYGFARSLASPAVRALAIDVAPPDQIERVIALRSVAFQAGGILGPVAAGFLFVADIAAPYLVSATLYLLAAALISSIASLPTRKLATRGGRQALRDALDGLRFIRRQPVIFGAISLDLFAVLLGGIIALLPAIAEERLGVGAVGLGGLRAAVSAGAATMAIVLSFRPLRRRVGKTLLGVIGLFGILHLLLAFTTAYAIACVLFFCAAALDAVSVFIRATLIPLATPEDMRGRVLAVENVFIGASNEMGAVESGVTAAVFGLVGAMVFGSIGTLVVVGLWWRLFPALRDVDRFDEVRAS
ncbi:MAG: MFS transporter [Actinomycetota bacterium]